MKNLLQNRRLRYGGTATALTVIFIAALVVINIIAGLLVERFPVLKLDLTRDKLFAVTEETKTYLQGLEEPVAITVLSTEQEFKEGFGEYGIQAMEVLSMYEMYGPSVSIKYMDLNKNPGLVTQYPDLTLSTGSIIVESGEQQRLLSYTDLYNIESDYYTQSSSITASKAEQALTSAIMYVTDRDPVTVTVLAGNQESVPQGLTELLEKNGYLVQSINFLTEDIDPETKLVISASPLADYSEAQTKKLDAYLDNNGQFGKHLLYFGSYDQTNIPNIDAFLKDWGLAVDPLMLVETDQSRYSGQPLLPLLNIASEDYAAEMTNKSGYILGFQSLAVRTLFETNTNRETAALLSTAGSAVLYPYTGEDAETWTTDMGEKGIYNSMALSKKTRYEGTTPITSTVTASGCPQMFSSSLLQEASLSNGDYFLSYLKTLTGKKTGVSIVSKTIGGDSMTLTGAQLSVLGWIFVGLIPLAVVVAGIVVWIKRRHL